MNRVTDPSPRHESGTVWATVRVGGQRWKIGAQTPGEWHIDFGGPETTDDDEARRLAKEWESANAAEARRLFAEAEAWRKANP